MKSDIVLAGVGGQGILSIAASIGMAAVACDLHLKQAEVHGMSQRGGDVQSHLRISSKPIASDLIPKGKADIILSVEPMESLRYLPYLSNKGWLVTNTKPYINIPHYPDMEELMTKIKELPRYIAIDADKIAEGIGSQRSSNIVMLGAGSLFIDMTIEDIEEGIRQVFSRKGEKVVELNISAFRAGRKAAEEFIARFN